MTFLSRQTSLRCKTQQVMENTQTDSICMSVDVAAAPGICLSKKHQDVNMRPHVGPEPLLSLLAVKPTAASTGTNCRTLIRLISRRSRSSDWMFSAVFQEQRVTCQSVSQKQGATSPVWFVHLKEQNHKKVKDDRVHPVGLHPQPGTASSGSEWSLAMFLLEGPTSSSLCKLRCQFIKRTYH